MQQMVMILNVEIWKIWQLLNNFCCVNWNEFEVKYNKYKNNCVVYVWMPVNAIISKEKLKEVKK